MSFLTSIFKSARPPSAPASTQFRASPVSMMPAASQTSTRRELVRVVLRDTLVKHGIPTAWITGEPFVMTRRNSEPGMHLRLRVHHWDTRLLTHGVAFQNALLQRIGLFDPLAMNWFMGISWQFALNDESGCPAMPPPTIWTAPADAAPVPPAATAPAPAPVVVPAPVPAPAPAPALKVPRGMEVSTLDPETADDLAELNRLFMTGDAEFAQRGAADAHVPSGGFAATEPARL
ncbi:MAG: hypothetical protein KF740_10360 [Ramlibacter sp.]|nr:hypothetical protein [Ramlibacter sp.]